MGYDFKKRFGQKALDDFRMNRKHVNLEIGDLFKVSQNRIHILSDKENKKFYILVLFKNMPSVTLIFF